MKCLICSSPMSESVPELFALPTVTSDCRPYKSGRSVEICSGCGVMHRVTNADFSDVYDGYVSYPEPTGRTAKILDFVKDKMPEPKSVLDVGCGQGLGIQELRKNFPSANVLGYDPYNPLWNTRPQEKFDLITLFHVLEHVEDLHEMLAYIKSSLTDNGYVLIQVPYTAMWPFDLILADHWWHFTSDALATIFRKSGFSVVYIGNDVIKKELTLVVNRISLDSLTIIHVNPPELSIYWLLSYKSFLDTINEPVAVMGTGPAAAWAGSILGDKVICYIDDDKTRWGIFNGKASKGMHWLGTADAIIAPFHDWQLAAIKTKHPNLRFL